MNTNNGAPIDVFSDTIAEMTWFDVEQAAKDGAVLLWAFGVIEQHGPHLPAGTDIYLPQARLRDVKRVLAERGVQALIMPPYYWGVNVVSGGFPASYGVRPEVMKELMADVFGNIESDGFRRVFCFSSHGDALHNRTIHDGIRLGKERTRLDIRFVIGAGLAKRLDLALDDPNLALVEDGAPEAFSFTQGTGTSPYVDVHAGRWETSMMLCTCPTLVHDDVRATLKSTDFGPNDLAEWRQGGEHARHKTPLGYLGDPAAASREEGVRSCEAAARVAADAIERCLSQNPTPHSTQGAK